MPRVINLLLPTAFGPILPHATEEPRRLALLGEAGPASCSGSVLRITLLVVEVGELLGGGAG